MKNTKLLSLIFLLCFNFALCGCQSNNKSTSFTTAKFNVGDCELIATLTNNVPTLSLTTKSGISHNLPVPSNVIRIRGIYAVDLTDIWIFATTKVEKVEDTPYTYYHYQLDDNTYTCLPCMGNIIGDWYGSNETPISIIIIPTPIQLEDGRTFNLQRYFFMTESLFAEDIESHRWSPIQKEKVKYRKMEVINGQIVLLANTIDTANHLTGSVVFRITLNEYTANVYAERFSYEKIWESPNTIFFDMTCTEDAIVLFNENNLISITQNEEISLKK